MLSYFFFQAYFVSYSRILCVSACGLDEVVDSALLC
jgi:hypothetical protein